MEKTNVSRLLDVAGIPYTMHEYDKEITDGANIARVLGEEPDRVFKTLVTVSNTREHFVFCVPVNCTLNLKKAAKAVGVKSIETIPQKTLLPLTGYVHGGCSPVGMKKQFRTVIHETAILFDTVCVSAGRIGAQAELSPQDLCAYVKGTFQDIAEE